MTLYLKKKYNNKTDSERVADMITEKSLRNFVETVSLDLTNKRIRIKFKKIKKSDLKETVSRLQKKVKNYKIGIKDDAMIVESKEKKLTIKDLQRIKKKLLDLAVSGIQSVKNAIVVKESDDWVIKTLGSNFLKVQNFEEIDFMRSYTNNIHELASVLGIEAARTALIKETKSTMKQQGLDIDDRHIMLVADTMTFSGEIKPVGRYGVAGMKSSVLTRAGFEETIKHLIKASVRHEEDTFDAIFDNVMVNQQVPVGTGMFELIAKIGEE
jgi:DNA-directed RNA polymerase subunit A"